MAGIWWASVYYPGLEGDWQSYRATLERLLSGGPLYPAFQHEPYGLGDAAWGAGYVYPPSSLPMLPLTAFVWPWRILNLGVLLTGVWIATRSPWAVALTIAFPATWAAWANGNSMPLIVGAYGIAFGWQARWPAVLAGAVKLYPLTLLILSWRRREPLKWPLIAAIAIGMVAIPFVPIFQNARPICDGWPLLLSFRCIEPIGAYAIGGLLLLIATLVRSERVAFAALCLAPFATAPDWTFVYYLLPWMAAMAFWSRAAR